MKSPRLDPLWVTPAFYWIYFRTFTDSIVNRNDTCANATAALIHSAFKGAIQDVAIRLFDIILMSIQVPKIDLSSSLVCYWHLKSRSKCMLAMSVCSMSVNNDGGNSIFETCEVSLKFLPLIWNFFRFVFTNFLKYILQWNDNWRKSLSWS